MPATRARLGVIFFTVFIDLVGFGIVLPILPYYAQSFGARGLLFGAIVGAYSGMQFLATAVLGRLWAGSPPTTAATSLPAPSPPVCPCSTSAPPTRSSRNP